MDVCMELTFYQRLEDWLINEDVAIATVIHVKGSVPREAGAKMIIKANGQIFGTIGGGAGEAKVIVRAQQFLTQRDKHQAYEDGDRPSLGSQSSEDDPSKHLQSSAKGWLDIDLTGASHRDTQGVCGGVMRVWVECWTNDWGGAIAHHIAQTLKKGASITLITPFAAHAVPYLVEANSPEIDVDISSNQFTEHIVPPPTLLIIGAGHVGVALVNAAQFAGFQVIVQDDRSDFTHPDRFPAQTQLLHGATVSALNSLSWPENLYIALVTRGVAFDLEALKLILNQIMKQPPRYIGMIGSLKRIRHVFQELEHQGMPHDLLKTIHAPIGLEIGALTPEEIAISICAELIQIRRKLDGQPMPV